MAKSLLALVFLPLLVSTVVLAEELETLPPTSPAPPPLHHPPTKSPYSHPPSHPPHHHHHHHHHPPSTAPSLPPHHHHYPPSPAPVHPPTHHHYPPSPAPLHPPTHHHYPPSPAPVHPPTHHHYPPSTAPVHPPVPVVKPPVHPPVPGVKPPVPVVKPPVHPPVPGVKPPVHAPAPVYHFPRSFVAVQGVVFVKSCHYAGLDTLLGATPVNGAVVKLQCNNTRYKLVQTAKTDKNGYFYVEGPKSVTTFGVHKCNVVLVSAPNGLKPSNLHGGVTGSSLRPEKPFVSNKLPFVLYTAGPLAFEPNCPH